MDCASNAIVLLALTCIFFSMIYAKVNFNKVRFLKFKPDLLTSLGFIGFLILCFQSVFKPKQL